MNDAPAIAAGGSKMTKEDKAREQKWETEEDLRTLIKAKEIKKDKKRMARVRAMAVEKSSEMKSL